MGRLRRRSLMVACGTVALATALPASAPAATTFGSDLSLAPNQQYANSNFVMTSTIAPPTSTTPVAAPVSGVLVRIRVRHGVVSSNPGRYAFRILTGNASPFTARPATPSGTNEPLAWAASAPAGIETYIPTDANGRPRGVSVSAGERLSIWYEVGTATQTIASGVTGAASAYNLSDHSTGSQPYINLPENHLLVQGVIEPDADADGYGDESQ